MRVPKLTRWCSRPCRKYKTRKAYVLVCCMGSAVYLAGQHVRNLKKFEDSRKKFFQTTWSEVALPHLGHKYS